MVDASRAMSGLTKEDALSIFKKFFRERLRISISDYDVLDRTFSVLGDPRKCKVVILTDNIRSLIRIDCNEDVHYIKLTDYKYTYEQYQGGMPEIETFLPALIVFCGDGGRDLLKLECENGDQLRSILESRIALAHGGLYPPPPPPAPAPSSALAKLSSYDVYYIFQEYMQKKTANEALKFDAEVRNTPCEHHVITLTDSIPFKIFIKEWEICIIECYGCKYASEAKVLVSKSASIHFLTSDKSDVCTIAGDMPTIRNELKKKVMVRMKPHPDPSPEECVAQLNQIIEACNTHSQPQYDVEFKEVIQICKELIPIYQKP